MIEKPEGMTEQVFRKKLRYMDDFLQIVKYANVALIHLKFGDDVERFCSATYKFATLKRVCIERYGNFCWHKIMSSESQKLKGIIEDWRNVFMINFTTKNLTSIFVVGYYVDGKFAINPQYWHFVESLIQDRKIYQRNSGKDPFHRGVSTDIFNLNRRMFMLSQQELEAIFADPETVQDILNMRDNVFTERQKKLIQKFCMIDEDLEKEYADELAKIEIEAIIN